MDHAAADIEKLVLAEEFSINNFLSKTTQKNDLETLRGQLKEYGITLHKSMTEIFKTETESIVDLAENLANLDSKINNLIQPASQLREEILTLYNTIKSNRESFHICLEALEKNKRDHHILGVKQNLLEAKNNVDILLSTFNNTADLLNFELVTNNYALYLSFANQLEIKDDRLCVVNPLLLKRINVEFLRGQKIKDASVVKKCLRMIVNLGQERHTENVYRENVLTPKLYGIFSQRKLESLGDDLSKLYERALEVIKNDMHFLLFVLKDNREFESFRFMQNSYWLEVDKLLVEGLGHVTAPGNPELFQRRFCATWDFLKTVTKYCEPTSTSKDLNAQIAAHVQRFNLPVYFEIRFQQISSNFETAFVRTTTPTANIYADNKQLDYKLSITGAFLDCFRMCFSPEIFIPHLSVQFVKLSMLLLARYCTWFVTITKLFKTKECTANEIALVYMLSDLALVRTFLGCPDLKLSIYNICETDLRDIVYEIIRLNNVCTNDAIQTTIKFIVGLKTEEVVTSLQNVNAIPRLYRKTNRNTPTNSSAYINDAIDVLEMFQNNFDKEDSSQAKNISDTIIANVATKFLVMVSDVLHSVSKTEESLKRLKRQTGNSSSDSMQTVDASSDNYKIREQIRLDVGRFVEKFTPICGENTKSELCRLAKSAGYVLLNVI